MQLTAFARATGCKEIISDELEKFNFGSYDNPKIEITDQNKFDGSKESKELFLDGGCYLQKVVITRDDSSIPATRLFCSELFKMKDKNITPDRQRQLKKKYELSFKPSDNIQKNMALCQLYEKEFQRVSAANNSPLIPNVKKGVK